MKRLGMVAVAISIVPGLLVAQADTSRMRGRDSTRARTEQSSPGSIGRRSYGLTRDQISQLQTALKQDDCNPGPIDGILGPRTRRAMACARQKNNITGNNPNDLFRSLNLSFTTPDSTGMGGVMSSGRRGARGARGTGADTTMRNPTTSTDTSMNRSMRRRGTNRTGRDTTMRRGMRTDSTRRPGTPPQPYSKRP